MHRLIEAAANKEPLYFLDIPVEWDPLRSELYLFSNRRMILMSIQDGKVIEHVPADMIKKKHDRDEYPLHRENIPQDIIWKITDIYHRLFEHILERAASRVDIQTLAVQRDAHTRLWYRTGVGVSAPDAAMQCIHIMLEELGVPLPADVHRIGWWKDILLDLMHMLNAWICAAGSPHGRFYMYLKNNGSMVYPVMHFARDRGGIPVMAVKYRTEKGDIKAADREHSHLLKNDDPVAIQLAAEAMADFIPDGAVLIPVPSHSGCATGMLQLAQELTLLCHGTTVCDILVSEPRPSVYDLKKAGRKVTPEMLGIRCAGTPYYGCPVVLIDNVYDTGVTARACFNAMSEIFTDVVAQCTLLVYADMSKGE